MTKILIIEDEETLANAVRKYLEEKGDFEVDWAADGEEGLQKAANADIILLDIVMPKTDGLQMLHTLRETSGLKDKKVIMMTNLDRDSDRDTAEKLGIERYLVKSSSTLVSICDVIQEVAEGKPGPKEEETEKAA